jgi:ParB/RepB/Spo0J family partition protein
MNSATTPLVEVEKIDVEQGFNARTHQTAGALERLSASVAQDGVIQPLLVKAGENGRVTVIAGHRRLEAAKLAGVERLPVSYFEGERNRQASLIENLHREDLDPIDAANGLKAIAEECNLHTNKEIAAQVQMSVQWVSERLRDFVREFDQLLVATAEGRFEDKPTIIDAHDVHVSTVIADPEERQELTDRVNAADPYMASEDPRVRFEEADLDAIRAAGCLIEHKVDQGNFLTTAAYITDAELAADILRRAVERQEAKAKKRAEEEAAWRERSGQVTGTPEEQKDARKAEREKAKKDAAKARKFNQDLGRNLVLRRGKGSQKQHGLARAKAIAAVVLADNRELSARGLGLVLSQLQEVEVKQLKSGEQRERVSYADTEQCRQYLANRIEKARTPNEVLELLGDALIAGMVADSAELPQSKRVRWWNGAAEQVQKLLGPDIKAVKPRRSSSKK